MKRAFERDGEVFALEAERIASADGGRQTLRAVLPDGSERVIAARRLPGNIIEVTEGSRIFRVPLAYGERAGTVFAAWRGESFSFAPASPARPTGSGSASAQHSGVLAAPMAGVVADITITVGETVAAYQSVAVVEAMKVLATLEAPFAGIVRAVHAKKGDRVEHGAPLVEIAPEGEEETAAP